MQFENNNMMKFTTLKPKISTKQLTKSNLNSLQITPKNSSLIIIDIYFVSENLIRTNY